MGNRRMRGLRRTNLGVVVLTMLAAGASIVGSSPSQAIVGGSTVSRGWAVAFINTDRSMPMERRIICSGVLVGSKVVATAKHCLDDIVDGDYDRVVIGRSNLTTGGTGFVTTAVAGKAHPTLDLALVKLGSRTAITPVKMSSTVRIARGNDIYPYGYGRTSTASSDRSRHLRRTTLRINAIENSLFKATWDCRNAYKGDSGGAATKYANGVEYLVGITSGTWLKPGDDPCAGSGYASLFVKTTKGGDTTGYDFIARYKGGW